MKNLILLTLTLLNLSVLSQDIYHYNQNYQANTYLKDGSIFKFYFTKQTFEGDKTSLGIKHELKKINLGYKDMDGNLAYALRFICKSKLAGKDTLYFVPDNKFYPTHYVYYDFNNSKKKYEELGNIVILNGGLLTSVVLSSFEKNNGNTNIIYTRTRSKPRLVIKGTGKGEINNIQEFNKKLNGEIKHYQSYGGSNTVCNEYPGIEKYTIARNKYLDQLISKSPSYDKQMENLLNGTMFNNYSLNNLNHQKKSYLKLHTQFEKNGKIKSIKLQVPFTDDKFYNKDKFYYECKKNDSGFYSCNLKNETLYLLPFDDLILLIKKSSYGSYYVNNVLCKENSYQFREPRAKHLLVGQHSSLGAYTSSNYWCNSELEENYSDKKDMYHYKNFWTKYIESLK